MKNINLYENENNNNDVYETLMDINDLYQDACTATMELLEDENITLSERLFAAKILELHSDIFSKFIEETYSDECLCDEDCENCPYNDYDA